MSAKVQVSRNALREVTSFDPASRCFFQEHLTDYDPDRYTTEKLQFGKFKACVRFAAILNDERLGPILVLFKLPDNITSSVRNRDARYVIELDNVVGFVGEIDSPYGPRYGLYFDFAPPLSIQRNGPSILRTVISFGTVEDRAAWVDWLGVTLRTRWPDRPLAPALQAVRSHVALVPSLTTLDTGEPLRPSSVFVPSCMELSRPPAFPSSVPWPPPRPANWKAHWSWPPPQPLIARGMEENVPPRPTGWVGPWPPPWPLVRADSAVPRPSGWPATFPWPPPRPPGYPVGHSWPPVLPDDWTPEDGEPPRPVWWIGPWPPPFPLPPTARDEFEESEFVLDVASGAVRPTVKSGEQIPTLDLVDVADHGDASAPSPAPRTGGDAADDDNADPDRRLQRRQTVPALNTSLVSFDLPTLRQMGLPEQKIEDVLQLASDDKVSVSTRARRAATTMMDQLQTEKLLKDEIVARARNRMDDQGHDHHVVEAIGDGPAARLGADVFENASLQSRIVLSSRATESCCSSSGSERSPRGPTQRSASSPMSHLEERDDGDRNPHTPGSSSRRAGGGDDGSKKGKRSVVICDGCPSHCSLTEVSTDVLLGLPPALAAGVRPRRSSLRPRGTPEDDDDDDDDDDADGASPASASRDLADSVEAPGRHRDSQRGNSTAGSVLIAATEDGPRRERSDHSLSNRVGAGGQISPGRRPVVKLRPRVVMSRTLPAAGADVYDVPGDALRAAVTEDVSAAYLIVSGTHPTYSFGATHISSPLPAYEPTPHSNSSVARPPDLPLPRMCGPTPRSPSSAAALAVAAAAICEGSPQAAARAAANALRHNCAPVSESNVKPYEQAHALHAGSTTTPGGRPAGRPTDAGWRPARRAVCWTPDASAPPTMANSDSVESVRGEPTLAVASPLRLSAHGDEAAARQWAMDSARGHHPPAHRDDGPDTPPTHSPFSPFLTPVPSPPRGGTIGGSSLRSSHAVAAATRRWGDGVGSPVRPPGLAEYHARHPWSHFSEHETRPVPSPTIHPPPSPAYRCVAAGETAARGASAVTLPPRLSRSAVSLRLATSIC